MIYAGRKPTTLQSEGYIASCPYFNVLNTRPISSSPPHENPAPGYNPPPPRLYYIRFFAFRISKNPETRIVKILYCRSLLE